MTTKPAGTGGVVIAHIEALLAERDHVLVAIDGPCASGKTMLAATVNKRFGGNVLHMDVFFSTSRAAHAGTIRATRRERGP